MNGNDTATTELLARLDELYPLPRSLRLRKERAAETAVALSRWMKAEYQIIEAKAMELLRRPAERTCRYGHEHATPEGAKGCDGQLGTAYVHEAKPCTCPIERWSARFGDHAPECPSGAAAGAEE